MGCRSRSCGPRTARAASSGAGKAAQADGWRGIRTLSVTVGSAPCRNNAVTVSSCPMHAARCMGVLPVCEAAAREAGADEGDASRAAVKPRLATLHEPSGAAQRAEVRPLHSAPFFSKYSTTTVFPFSAALCSPVSPTCTRAQRGAGRCRAAKIRSSGEAPSGGIRDFADAPR